MHISLEYYTNDTANESDSNSGDCSEKLITASYTKCRSLNKTNYYYRKPRFETKVRAVFT